LLFDYYRIIAATRNSLSKPNLLSAWPMTKYYNLFEYQLSINLYMQMWIFLHLTSGDAHFIHYVNKGEKPILGGGLGLATQGYREVLAISRYGNWSKSVS
jgi:hypothetical protein